jgi:hypothetical protein
MLKDDFVGALRTQAYFSLGERSPCVPLGYSRISAIFPVRPTLSVRAGG